MRYLFIIFFCWSASGQLFDPMLNLSVSVSGGATDPWAYYPTNISGVPAKWWYAPSYSGAWTTNAGTPTLIDMTGNGYSATNLAAAGNWPSISVGSLNSLDTITFDGIDDYLVCQLTTNIQPFEIVLVVKIDMQSAATRSIFSGYNNSGAQAKFYNYGGYVASLYAGSSLDSVNMSTLTNKWWVFNCMFTNGGSLILTNKGTLVSGNSGTQAQNGLSIGTTYNIGSQFSKLSIAEIVCYTNILSTENRSNIFHYMTNRYAISP